MKIGLFIPCYIDQFFPEVGMSVVRLFRHLNLDFTVPPAQTCCGQPLSNSGHVQAAQGLMEKYYRDFGTFDYIVTPSGSCASTVRNNFSHPVLAQDEGFQRLRRNTYELCEFLVDIAKVDSLGTEFAHKVGIHRSCQGVRSLGLGGATESPRAVKCKITQLAKGVRGLEIVEPKEKTDECCGFGGSFSTKEADVSAAMGIDRLDLFRAAGADYVTATDMGCLAHLQGLARKKNYPLKIKHIASVLAGDIG